MGKPYVCWRRPDGRPYSDADGRFALTNLLADIGESSFLNADGNLAWHNMPFRFKPAFQASVLVRDGDGVELNASDAWTITRTAILSAINKSGAGNAVSHTEFIRHANIKAQEYFRQPAREFALVTSLSVASMPAKTMRVRGCSVSPLASRARFPFPERLKSRVAWTRFAKHLGESQYQLVRVRVAGRTVHDAVTKATDALAQLCGLWNLFATLGGWSMNFGMGRHKPLAAVHLGPIHTLHEPTGKPVDDVYWYEPGYVEDLNLFQPRNGWDRIEQDRRWALGRLRVLPYRRDLEGLIERYTQALQEPNLDVAFLRMWSILEKISNTEELKGYDETIRRIVWPYRDRQLAGEVLEALRQQRNMMVHAARSADDADQVMYTVKSFVDPHLLRLLRNDFKVNSLEEYGRHLALSTDPDQLRRHRRRVDIALRFLREAAAPRAKK